MHLVQQLSIAQESKAELSSEESLRGFTTTRQELHIHTYYLSLRMRVIIKWENTYFATAMNKNYDSEFNLFFVVVDFNNRHYYYGSEYVGFWDIN